MPNPYDVALRERAVAAYDRGEGTYAAVAALFLIDHRTLERWVARWRATRSVEPLPKGGGWACPIALSILRTVIADTPDATIAEICRAYNRRVPRAQQTTETSCRRAMHRDGYVLKKNGRARVRSIGRMSTRSARLL